MFAQYATAISSLVSKNLQIEVRILSSRPDELRLEHVCSSLVEGEIMRATVHITPMEGEESWRFHKAYVESVTLNESVAMTDDGKLLYFLMTVGMVAKGFLSSYPFEYTFDRTNDQLVLAVSDEVLKTISRISPLVLPCDDINYLHGDSVSKILGQLAQNDIVVTRSGVTTPTKDYAFILEVPAVEGASYVIYGDDKALYLVGDGPSTMGHLVTMEYRTDCHGPTSRDLDLVINHLEAYGVPQERALNLALGMVHCVTEGNRTLTRVSQDFCAQLETVEKRLWQHDFAKVWQLLDPRLPGRMINDAAMQAVAEWMKKHNIRIHQNS